MQQSDRRQFIALMADIGERYGKCISEPLMGIYWQALACFEWEDVENALQAHIHNPDTRQFFPKPLDIVRFIEGSGETKALRAWTIVQKAICRVGVYQSLAFDDALIHAVIEDMGGWVHLCSMTLEDAPFRALEFQKRYLSFVIQKPKRYPRYLFGINEIENTKNNYLISGPLLIGDVERAKAVMRGGGGVPLLIHDPKTVQSLIESFVQPTVEKKL